MASAPPDLGGGERTAKNKNKPSLTSPASSPYLSYSASAKKVTQRSHMRQTRNVLIVTLEKPIEGSQVNVDDDLIETICKAVGLTAVLNTQGYQVFFKPKEVWVGIELKVGINPENDGSRERRTVSDSLTIIQARDLQRDADDGSWTTI